MMDVFNKPTTVDENVLKNLGPLTPLAGMWEGDEGIDISPSRTGPVETKFRERLTFEPMGPVINGPQILYGLRYTTTAWPLGQEKPFHEEVGYWLYDAQAQQVMRCFIVPRGVTVQAGGSAEPQARTFEMTAAVGSETYGITSNPFLDQSFKTVLFTVTVTIHDHDRFSYAEDTQLQSMVLRTFFITQIKIPSCGPRARVQPVRP